MVPPDLPVPAHQPAPVRPVSRRRKILDYVASRGGEIRSDSGQGLRRQIADALGERPTVVSQATTVPGATALPRTGSSSGYAVFFGLSCIAGGALLLIRRGRNWIR